jgi:3-hydroxy-3-methylglutaryl CoA synthase
MASGSQGMMMQYGITGFGAYIPRLRMSRAAIAAAHKWMSPSLTAAAKGTRAFCNWDEDSITMAVEAARDCLRGGSGTPAALVLATTTSPYADLQPAAIVAHALDLPATLRTSDLGGSQRAATSALVSALHSGQDDVLVIASDRPAAKPASAQELSYGAGAACLRLGQSGVIARLVGSASIAAVLVDHFRASDSKYDYHWEERWVRDEGYAGLACDAAKAALEEAKLAVGDIHHFVMPSQIRGAAEVTARGLGFKGEIAPALDDGCGYAGAAQVLLMLARVLETAQAGQRILVIGFGQGADAIVLEMTQAASDVAGRRAVSGALADQIVCHDYLRMLSSYGQIELDWGMRGERTGKAALTEQYRSSMQLDSFKAGRCKACQTVQFPQIAYCVNPACNAPASQFESYRLVDEPARVLTFTADWLSFYPAPPLYVGFVQFAVGARLIMETIDVGPGGLEVGAPLRTVFRIKERDAVRGYNRYFWKTTPIHL